MMPCRTVRDCPVGLPKRIKQKNKTRQELARDNIDEQKNIVCDTFDADEAGKTRN
jgi:hypothetical protein